jgi:hypothetical protein
MYVSSLNIRTRQLQKVAPPLNYFMVASLHTTHQQHISPLIRIQMFNEPLNIAACSRIFYIVVYLTTNVHCSTKQNDPDISCGRRLYRTEQILYAVND